MLHVVIFGPTGCGKSTVAASYAQNHKRCVVTLDEIVN